MLTSDRLSSLSSSVLSLCFEGSVASSDISAPSSSEFELSVLSQSPVTSNNFTESAAKAELLRQIEAVKVALHRARSAQEQRAYQISSIHFPEDDESGTFTETDIESVFDHLPASETELDTDASSVWSDDREFAYACDPEKDIGDELLLESWKLSTAPTVQLYDGSEAASATLDFAEVPPCEPQSSEFNQSGFGGDTVDTISRSSSACVRVHDALNTSVYIANCKGASTDRSDVGHSTAESCPNVESASFVDFFVPELFDIPVDTDVGNSSGSAVHTPGDSLPSHRETTSEVMSRFSFARAYMKAEYLQLIISFFVVCFNVFCCAFWPVKLALQAFAHCDNDSDGIFEAEETPSKSCDAKSHSTSYSSDPQSQDRVDFSAEPVPPDKCFHFDDSLHLNQVFSLELTRPHLQDISIAPPGVPAIELNQPQNSHDSQRKFCKPFISFEPSTNQPSNHEPYKRAEFQPFYPCTFDVDELQYFESCRDFTQAVTRIIPVRSPEPEDDPPSYLASIYRTNDTSCGTDDVQLTELDYATVDLGEQYTNELRSKAVPPDKF
ncbi:hypothetical protein K438DRAFT_1769895 [Mycena galopus ATCC 62051]|nr:hypothetical protein K438DRAFT_1769895 [Mycena galopus ATCC 62051]